MDREKIKAWLQAVASGEMAPGDVLEKLEKFPYQDLDFAKIDSHRSLRSGQSEVIYCPGKTAEQVVKIFSALSEQSQNVIATRANSRIFKKVQAEINGVEYFESARIIALWRERKQTVGTIGVISAGTADLPVAEEACITSEVMGSKVSRIYDVGVAGIHRLFDKKTQIDSCRVLIIVAGMEGALASVVGGLVSQPVIAVPTSVGYGANLNGIATLLSMLNSCASGIGVVNINNGFGAGMLAHRINLLGEKDENTLS